MSFFDGIARGDVVAADAIDSLSDDDFEVALGRFLQIKQAVAATELHLLDSARRRRSHVRHGFRDTAAWVASLAGERPGAVRRDVVLAEQVAAAPVVASAVAAGAVSKAQAGVLVGAAELPAEVQERLVERAERLSVRELGQAVREAQYDHGLTPPAARPNLELRKTDGGGVIEGNLDTLGFEIVETAVQAAAEQMGLPTDVPIGERRAAALVAIARHFLERAESPVTKRTGLAHILGIVRYETLVATEGGSATLASGAVISGEVARMLACDAGISRIITRGESEILDAGRATRTIPVAIAKAVIARDRHCTHPGCHAPPSMCEIHHDQHWAHGGETSVENCKLLCWFHHQLEHQRAEEEHRRRRADAA
jgi:hypothetical protein